MMKGWIGEYLMITRHSRMVVEEKDPGNPGDGSVEVNEEDPATLVISVLLTPSKY